MQYSLGIWTTYFEPCSLSSYSPPKIVGRTSSTPSQTQTPLATVLIMKSTLTLSFISYLYTLYVHTSSQNYSQESSFSTTPFSKTKFLLYPLNYNNGFPLIDISFARIPSIISINKIIYISKKYLHSSLIKTISKILLCSISSLILLLCAYSMKV